MVCFGFEFLGMGGLQNVGLKFKQTPFLEKEKCIKNENINFHSCMVSVQDAFSAWPSSGHHA